MGTLSTLLHRSRNLAIPAGNKPNMVAPLLFWTIGVVVGKLDLSSEAALPAKKRSSIGLI